MSEEPNIAVIRIRGPVNVPKDVEDTLKMLHLHRNNFCSVHKDSPTLRGMLRKVKDYTTYGTIPAELVEKLKKTSDKPYYRLHPPKGGFERKGTKKPFTIGGALGDRKDKMNILVEKML